jgi:beta-galactosidase GanA
VTIHPSFDPSSGLWFTDDAEAPSLRELRSKLGGHRVRIAGYFPGGYRERAPWADERRPLFVQSARSARVPAKPMERLWSGPQRRYDHDAVLDMWARGKSAPEIAAELGISNWKRAGEIVVDARNRGDPRAVSRKHARKEDGRRKSQIAVSAEPSSRDVGADRDLVDGTGRARRTFLLPRWRFGVD